MYLQVAVEVESANNAEEYIEDEDKEDDDDEEKEKEKNDVNRCKDIIIMDEEETEVIDLVVENDYSLKSVDSKENKKEILVKNENGNIINNNNNNGNGNYFIIKRMAVPLLIMSIDMFVENSVNLKRIIHSTLIDINNISVRIENQQQLVELANSLVDLKEMLIDPKNNISKILPPALNTNTKGRKKGTKRLEILQEIVKKEQEAKMAKEKKDKINQEKKQKLQEKQEKQQEKQKRKIEATGIEAKEEISKKIKSENNHLTTTIVSINTQVDNHLTR